MSSENSELKRFSHCIGQNWYHVVLTPKYRYPVFRFPVSKIVAEQAFVWVCERHQIQLFTKEVMPDHVHLFVAYPPLYSVRKMVQVLKGGSSHYIRKAIPSLRKYAHLWNRGSMYRSIGNVSAETVRKYIDSSKNTWSNDQQKILK